MGDPHNLARVGETWNLERIEAQLAEIHAVTSASPIISGGWAWHFMSPTHREVKIFHDHSDIDLFIDGVNFYTFRTCVTSRGFKRVKTKYDSLSFMRYTKFLDTGKVVFDTYIQSAPFVVANGQRVVAPKHLLSLYKTTHQSRECVAVQAAKRLVADGKEVVGHPSLVGESG
jgi:hypothetical protein